VAPPAPSLGIGVSGIREIQSHLIGDYTSFLMERLQLDRKRATRLSHRLLQRIRVAVIGFPVKPGLGSEL
jgi:hypothetical protein